METQPAGGLLLYGLYSQSMLARDVQAMHSLFHDSGFPQVKVAPVVQDDYQNEAGRVKVTVAVDEGPQTLVGKLTITGNDTFQGGEILGMIVSSEGQPYSDANLARDQTQVTNFYFNQGYPNVKFEATARPVKDNPERMELTYKITEGQRFYFDQILVSGLHYTKPLVVEREEKGVNVVSGDPLNQEKMLELQRRLYDLGIFNSVDMAVQKPDGDTIPKNLNVQIEEARRYTLNYEVRVQIKTRQPPGPAPHTPRNTPAHPPASPA